ncbi:hypothetical protein TWF730_005095 [Orbilia blumenaviensis]|uniref:WLM domain-containing protein n=1 Tax=Orbilia blumenaviensis TaxID=1796055 RepID=A0AAV9VH97_9PEZI
MPLGFERLNERAQRPNKNINFIKPLDGPDKAIAQDILERVAAIVYPIMKKNHLYVMALEEFPPNREFWGRNFNAGEVIQLVLKNPHNAKKWHNHSRRFHKHRLGYVSELAELKGKGYTGEGFWGKGTSLHPSANLTGDQQIPKEELPEDLCGGVYRRVKKKRDPRKKVDYQEQKRRRIIKKFGSLEGNTVGGDDELRLELEKGKKPKGKPRVASSARGRDLRAEAALKRFETQKKEEEAKKEENVDSESESESEGEGELVKLEDDEVDMKAMMEEMSALACGGSQASESSKDAFPEIGNNNDSITASSSRSVETPTNKPGRSDVRQTRKQKKEPAVIVLSDDDDMPQVTTSKSVANKLRKETDTKKPGTLQSSTPAKVVNLEEGEKEIQERLCGACQMSNDHNMITCMVCSNVLREGVQAWKCKSESCKNSDSGYRNSIDVLYCGVCGRKR